MSHFIEKCECGIVLLQCKCFSPEKEVRVKRPCTHSTNINTKPTFNNITINDLLDAYRDFSYNHTYIPRRFKCSPQTYLDIKDYFAKRELEESVLDNRDYKTLPHNKYFTSVLGVEIYIDRDMPYGEFEFE